MKKINPKKLQYAGPWLAVTVEKEILGIPQMHNVYIMGISHAEFGPRGIKNEWVLFDETMIWKQILMKTG